MNRLVEGWGIVSVEPYNHRPRHLLIFNMILEFVSLPAEFMWFRCLFPGLLNVLLFNSDGKVEGYT